MTAIPVERPVTGPGELVPARRPMPPWLVRTPSIVVSGVGEACQRVVEFTAARYVKSAVVAATAWPLLDSGQHVVTIASAAGVTVVALVTGRRRSLLRVGEAIRYRHQVRKVKRSWRRVSGVAALRRRTPASELVGKPTKAPDRMDVPVLLIGWRSWRRQGWHVRYLGPRKTPYGIRVTIDGENTCHIVHAFASESGVIQGGLAATGTVMAMNQYFKHMTDISILWADPFAKVIRPETLPPAREPFGVTLALDSSGDPLEHSLRLPLLVVGRKGSGKSCVDRRLLEGLCESGQPFLLYVFDPKADGQEFGWLRDVAWHYESKRTEWPDFVARISEAMALQGRRLTEAGEQECPAMDKRFPLIVVLVDELVTAMGQTSKTKKISICGEWITVENALIDFLTQSRSVGATMMANSQVAQKERLPLRDLFDHVICLGVNNRETAQIATGDASAHPAHEIPPHPDYAGIGYMASADYGVSKMRAAFTGKEAIPAIKAGVAYWTRFYRDRERV